VASLGALGVLAAGVPGVSKRFKPLTAMFAGTTAEVITYPVRPANLPVTVVERGSLESASNKDVYCQVEGSTTIIMIVPEGTRVTKGQLVCELDSASLKDQLTSQMITTKGADASYANAKLTREVAEIAVVEYVEGVFKQDFQTAKGEIALAESNRKRAEDRVEWSAGMLKKGYVSPGQNKSEELSLQQAKFNEEQAQTKKDVLEKYTKEKTIKELKSEVEKTRSDELAKQATWQLEVSKEQKLQRQIVNCKITAPDDGLVVYANDPNRFGGSQTPQIEEGASVRERQKIFSLPDITKMQVNAKVHESMINQISRGLRARIKVDAFPATTLVGAVTDVAPLPDPSSFFSSDVKVYSSKVSIEKGLPDLRPGMQAEVTILITELENVLSIPVVADLQYGGKDHVAAKRADGGFEFREVSLGISNDSLVEVKTGIKPGDLVALNPIALMSDDEKRAAFGSTGKDAGKKDWGAERAKIGQTAVPKDGPAGKEKGADKAKAKGKGGRGGGAFMAKLQTLSGEERGKLFGGGASPEEREALLKKAGLTDEEIQQMAQMRANGGGRGGPGGPGGPGGGGGYGGGGGERP